MDRTHGGTRDRVDPIVDHIRERRPERGTAGAEVYIRIRRLAHHLETESRRRLAPQGIEFWELPLLSSLVRSPQPLSVGTLQDQAQVTPGAMTQRLTKLEAGGHVRRSFDGRDRRQVNVEITEAGRERFELVARAMEQVEAELFGELGTDLLGRLATDLREVQLATEGPDPRESWARGL